MNRRKFIKTSIISTLGTSTLIGLYSWHIEPFWLEFVHKTMPIKNLPKSHIGMTLMQISDIHIGNQFDYQFIIDSFVKAQALRPDYVVYTGDYVSWESKEQLTQLQEVMNHAVLGKMGTYAILGNHDYGRDWSEISVAEDITQILNDSKINVLSNTSTNTDGLNIIGMDDYWGLNYDSKTIKSHYKKEAANIALVHNPDVCDHPIWEDYDSWILSGHTHGGQVKAPFLNPFILPVVNKSYSSGKIDLTGNRTLYINRALGHLWQVRFNVRPEITVFHLSQA